MLYYCNTVRWAWLDYLSGLLTTLLQYLDTFGWVFLTCNNRCPYNLYCVGGDVKPCLINQSISQSINVLDVCGACTVQLLACSTLAVLTVELIRRFRFVHVMISNGMVLQWKLAIMDKRYLFECDTFVSFRSLLVCQNMPCNLYCVGADLKPCSTSTSCQNMSLLSRECDRVTLYRYVNYISQIWYNTSKLICPLTGVLTLVLVTFPVLVTFRLLALT